MISRFTQIKGVGKFINSRPGAAPWGANTLIFGENTSGKSTLTDILWSFKTGNPAFIEGRKSFGYVGEPVVELVDSNNNVFNYPGEDWGDGSNLVEIFDTHFINENIFEGSEIRFENQKKLHSIIIGSEGKRLADEMAISQERFDEISKDKTDRTRTFNQQFDKKISMVDFHNLPKYENPDALIKELQSTIDVASNQERIKEVFDGILKLLDNIVNQPTKSILQQTIETNAELVTAHIQKNWKNINHTKDFLQTGVNLTKEEAEICVFCGQSLDASAMELLKTYSQVFSEEYKKFHADVTATVEKFDRFSPSQIIENVKDKLQAVSIQLDLTGIDNSAISAVKKTADTAFRAKKENLSAIVNFSSYDELIQIFQEVKDRVKTLSEKYILTTGADIPVLQQKIFEIEMSKTRHTEKWDEFFRKEHELEASQKEIKKQRDALREELNDYSDTLYETHFDSINNILSETGADFRICDFKPLKKLVGKSERVFEIEFYDEYKVMISETAPHQPRFQNSLSESDKRLLAFAFFYSILLHEENLENKIIIFDDPFSSFDINRRTKTAELLANPYLISTDGERIEKKFDQLVILTHERDFFKWLSENLDKPTLLKIVDDGEDNGVKKSTLVQLSEP